MSAVWDRQTVSDTLTIGEAAERAGVCTSTLSRAIDAGTVPVPKLRIGKSVRLPRARFEQWVRGEIAGVSVQPVSGGGEVPAASPSPTSQ